MLRWCCMTNSGCKGSWSDASVTDLRWVERYIVVAVVILAAVGQGMIGSKMGDVVIQRDIPWMVDLYKQGRLKLDELISARWRLDQVNEAIADTKTGSAKRNVIIFD